MDKKEILISSDDQPRVIQLLLKLQTELKIEREAREQAEADCVNMFSTLKNIKEIMDESEGIAGWHLNGDISPWEEGLFQDVAKSLSGEGSKLDKADQYIVRLETELENYKRALELACQYAVDPESVMHEFLAQAREMGQDGWEVKPMRPGTGLYPQDRGQE